MKDSRRAKRVQEEEALLESKKKSLRSELVAEVRVASAAYDDPKRELLKIQMAQLVEMVTLLATKIVASTGENVSGPCQS